VRPLIVWVVSGREERPWRLRRASDERRHDVPVTPAPLIVAGAFQFTDAWPTPAVARHWNSRPGAPTTIGRLAFDAQPGREDGARRDLNVKVVPLVSPVTVSVVAAELNTRELAATTPTRGVTV